MKKTVKRKHHFQNLRNSEMSTAYFPIQLPVAF